MCFMKREIKHLLEQSFLRSGEMDSAEHVLSVGNVMFNLDWHAFLFVPRMSSESDCKGEEVDICSFVDVHEMSMDYVDGHQCQ